MALYLSIYVILKIQKSIMNYEGLISTILSEVDFSQNLFRRRKMQSLKAL